MPSRSGCLCFHGSVAIISRTHPAHVTRGNHPGGSILAAKVAQFLAAVDTADILMAVADRFALEITFRDCKEVVGAGQQQVRFLWANIGAFHVCLWTFTMTEAWAWSRAAAELVDRSASPWDTPLRRPSHADKRRAWRRALLGEEIRAVLRPGVTGEEIQATAERLLSLAA